MHRKPIRNLAVAIAASTALSGCADFESTLRTTSYPKNGRGEIVTVDAKQRHLFLNPEFEVTGGTPGSQFVKWRVCAEAAPDVFSALASSGALTLDLSSQPSGEAGFSMAETAGTIQRTQSVNLIRESFYRTCERFASGAMSRQQFIVQAARDQRAMVATLAIEQLTGAVRPASTILSGPATQAAALSGEEAAKLVRDYRDRLAKAEGARDAAKTAYETANKPDGECSKDAAKCAQLKLDADNAEITVKAAQDGLDNALKLAQQLTSSAFAASQAGVNSSAGISQADISSANLAAVAQAVVEIQKSAGVNEPLMFCIAYLTETKDPALPAFDETTKKDVLATCLAILEQRAQADDLFVTQRVSFRPSAAQDIFVAYTDRAKVSAAELARRNRLLLQAMTAAGLGQSPGDLLRIQASGPEAVQLLLLAEARKLETDPVGKLALQPK